jgi:hypothetical protein
MTGTPKSASQSYVSAMPSRQFQPCIPTRAAKVPAGTSPNSVKVKNPKHPAMTRVKEAFKDQS